MFPRRLPCSPIVTLALALAVAFLVKGCGNAPQGPTQAASPPGLPHPQTSRLLGGVLQDVLTLNTDDVLEATVATADGLILNPGSRVETDSDVFDYDHGEDLWTTFGYYADYNAGEIQVKEARFIVDQYSVPAEAGQVNITMTVTSGTTLNDISVKFDPSGFKFLKGRPARLVLTLRGKDVPEDVEAYHIQNGNGAKKIEVTYEERDGLLEKHVIITMEVPGFSKYTLGGGGE